MCRSSEDVFRVDLGVAVAVGRGHGALNVHVHGRAGVATTAARTVRPRGFPPAGPVGRALLPAGLTAQSCLLHEELELLDLPSRRTILLVHPRCAHLSRTAGRGRWRWCARSGGSCRLRCWGVAGQSAARSEGKPLRRSQKVVEDVQDGVDVSPGPTLVILKGRTQCARKCP